MLQIAHIGAGKFGLNHIGIFERSRNASIAMVCDLSETNLKKAAVISPKAKLTTKPEDVFSDKSIDAVVIAATSESHFDLGMKTLRNDKHCFVEKPMALNVEDAQRLVEEAEKRRKVLMVGHLLEYHPAVVKMKALVDSGSVGRIRYLNSVRVNLGTIRKIENVLWSFAPHDISVMTYLLQQEPVAVSAVGACFIQKKIHDVVFFTLRFADGALAQGHVSWLDPRKIRTFTVVGERKMMVLDDLAERGKLQVFDKGAEAAGADGTPVVRDGGVTTPELESYDPLKAELESFLECIETRRTPRNDGRDGLRVVKVLEAAQHSLEQQGVPVEIS